MNVEMNKILTSAENLVKRKSAAKLDRESGVDEIAVKDLSTKFDVNLNAKYQILHNKLTKLQSELTREQTRLGVLQDKNLKGDELKNLYFGLNPLFNESIDEIIEEKERLVKEIDSKKIFITEEIKAIEIETENIYAVSEVNGLNYEDVLESIKKAVSPLPGNLTDKKVEDLIKD